MGFGVVVDPHEQCIGHRATIYQRWVRTRTRLSYEYPSLTGPSSGHWLPLVFQDARFIRNIQLQGPFRENGEVCEFFLFGDSTGAWWVTEVNMEEKVQKKDKARNKQVKSTMTGTHC